MIPAKELRIGSLVQSKISHRQKPSLLCLYNYEISKIDSFKCGVRLIEDGAANFYKPTHLLYDQIYPIKISEPYLRMFGLKDRYNRSWFKKKITSGNNFLGDYFVVSNIKTHPEVRIIHKDKVVFYFTQIYEIHKLQNLYYNLVEEEIFEPKIIVYGRGVKLL